MFKGILADSWYDLKFLEKQVPIFKFEFFSKIKEQGFVISCRITSNVIHLFDPPIT